MQIRYYDPTDPDWTVGRNTPLEAEKLWTVDVAGMELNKDARAIYSYNEARELFLRAFREPKFFAAIYVELPNDKMSGDRERIRNVRELLKEEIHFMEEAGVLGRGQIKLVSSETALEQALADHIQHPEREYRKTRTLRRDRSHEGEPLVVTTGSTQEEDRESKGALLRALNDRDISYHDTRWGHGLDWMKWINEICPPLGRPLQDLRLRYLYRKDLLALWHADINVVLLGHGNESTNPLSAETTAMAIGLATGALVITYDSGMAPKFTIARDSYRSAAEHPQRGIPLPDVFNTPEEVAEAVTQKVELLRRQSRTISET